MDNLIYSYAKEDDREKMLFLTEKTAEGAELYSFLMNNSCIPEGSIWCGKNEKGKIFSLIFNDGDRNILSYGDLFPDFLTAEKCVYMKYTGSFMQSQAVKLKAEDIKELYMLLSGENKLSFDNVSRCAERKRAVLRGYASVFGIYKENRLISSASITAMNKNYAFTGDVFTELSERNRGFAGMCVYAAVNEALKNKKIPVLRCENNMCAFYERLGFEKI